MCPTHLQTISLSAALRTVDQLDPGAEFAVQDLVPPILWQKLPAMPVRAQLGAGFAKEMEKRPDVKAIGKTEQGQAKYLII